VKNNLDRKLERVAIQTQSVINQIASDIKNLGQLKNLSKGRIKT